MADSVINITSALTALLKKDCVPMVLYLILSATNASPAIIILTLTVETV